MRIEITKFGIKRYYNARNQYHREDGPAIEYPDGSKEWWVNGREHRTNGPAIDFMNGPKYWHIHGKLHREDGPAVEFIDGTKRWYINGVQLTEEEFRHRTNRTCKCSDYLK